MPLRLLLAFFSVCALMTINIASSFASPAKFSNPATVLASSYQAMDVAMSAGNPVRNPASLAISSHSLLLPASAYVSNTPSGKALYLYDVERISVLRSWAALHTHDYSAVKVWSTFQVTSQVLYGIQATVTGNEVLHIDATIQDNGQAHHFSYAKQAAQTWIKKAGLYLGVGDTNHETAIINHTATLQQSGTSWVIESDNYWDPLAQPLASDHHTLLKQTQTGAKNAAITHSTNVPTLLRPAAANYSAQRQSSINYAETWWNSCNPNYYCYVGQGTDCANFVSQALSDPSGANLNNDSTWTPGSLAFVNAIALYNYMAPSPYSAYYYGEYFNYNEAASADAAYVYPGDLIFYDWGNVFGYGPANGTQNHVAISVTQDANGYTYEDAHTTNLHHAYWDLGGGTQSGYWFITMAY